MFWKCFLYGILLSLVLFLSVLFVIVCTDFYKKVSTSFVLSGAIYFMTDRLVASTVK